MQVLWRALLAIGALQFAPALEAQIYTCTAADGTRIFSDEKCGPDAKVVPNISTSKKPARTSTPRPKVEPRSPAELDALLDQCNGGDMKACDTWTRGGGPNRLRDKEQSAERSCEAGSLADCEYRYCSGNVSEECRARVLQVAQVTGDNWYLHDTGTALPDGSTRYAVRCLVPNARSIAQVTVTCAAQAGPNRCSAMGRSGAYGRLDLAATAACSAR